MFEKSMEEHAKNLQNRMDQLEADPLREHQTAIQTLQQKIRQLQEEISIKRSRYAEAAETVRKMDRRVKEMQFKVEEDRKNHQRIQGMVDQLRQSIRLVRIQSQEAVSEVLIQNVSIHFFLKEILLFAYGMLRS
ncbi:hypothetical protein TNCT_205481 [Trichonephila clavata]|uniref:Uncharacterized protein n=1 Tax=Trichonephila clavata TaxID=2740835 RepID=A0A8X6JND5_TRICU|nr:hypothetical protein TNCT_205481 [Trichonephila clavata]